MQTIHYNKVLIKLSGEALMGNTNDTFDHATINNILTQIKELYDLKVKIAIVIGGGNIFRGRNNDLNLNVSNADYMGMIATIINGIALKDMLLNIGVKTKIYSAISVSNMVKPYNLDSALKNFNDDNVVIFTGGTGNPFFTTDSAAAIRAIEMQVDILIKATKVNGVYDKDPNRFADAVKYKQLTFTEAIQQELQIMDITAFNLCKTHNINIKICNIFENNALVNVVMNNNIGTLITR